MLESITFEREMHLLSQSAQNHEIPGGVFAVIMPNESRKFYFGNRAVVPDEIMMTEDTMFDLASLTKVVSTTTAALQCLEQGLFSLQTEVYKIIPEFPHKRITIEHLMTHTSGICGDDKKYKSCLGKQELIDFFLQKDLVFETGTKVEYSDFGYILLGMIVEKMVGDLDAYTQKYIFEPLQMQDTCFKPKEHGKAQRCAPTELTSERGLICGEVHDGKAWRMGGVSGNAGLFSTVQDLSRFVQMLLQGGTLDGEKILSKSTIRLLEQCYTDGLNARRTVGWISNDKTAQMGDYYSNRCIFHTGFTGTSIYVDFERQCGIILLTNRIHPDRSQEAIFEIRRKIHNLTLLDLDDSLRKAGR